LIYAVVVINPDSKFPEGGGRPFNGGFGKGGGILALSSYAMTKMDNFQSTLRHELGHTFGLPHVDAYKYDLYNNPSIMSYTKAHHTQWFEEPRTPGILIPEDRRALARNQKVFPGLLWDKTKDVPSNYTLCPQIVGLPPMQLPTSDK
jgi:hypothetical protein